MSAYSDLVLATAGLVSYWRLGEPSGTNAADSAGSNAGTYTGGFTLNQAGALWADSDGSVSLNGSTGYVAVPFAAGLNPASTWTVGGWMFPTAFSGTDDMSLVWSRENPGSHRGYDFGLNVTAGKPRVTIGNGTAFTNLLGPSAVALNAWSHMVATYDGTQARIYLNGPLVAGPTTIGYTANPAQSMGLGGLGGAGGFLTGQIDEIAVYNRALTALEIAQHYAVGAPPRVPPPRRMPGPGT